jgi:hypothetical protein
MLPDNCREQTFSPPERVPKTPPEHHLQVVDSASHLNRIARVRKTDVFGGLTNDTIGSHQIPIYADHGSWTKLLQLLHSVVRPMWGPLLAASLVAGFQYLLKKRDEKRTERKRLSDQLYIRFRQQLAEAETLSVPRLPRFSRSKVHRLA